MFLSSCEVSALPGRDRRWPVRFQCIGRSLTGRIRANYKFVRNRQVRRRVPGFGGLERRHWAAGPGPAPECDRDISSNCRRISSNRRRISGSFMVGRSTAPDMSRIISDIRFNFEAICSRFSDFRSTMAMSSYIRPISLAMSLMIPAIAWCRWNMGEASLAGPVFGTGAVSEA